MPLDVGIPELLLIFMVVLMVFGPGKLPELARGLGGFVRDLRKAANELTRDLTEGLEDPKDKGRVIGTRSVCAHCGGLNPLGQLYCGQCGRALS